MSLHALHRRLGLPRALDLNTLRTCLTDPTAQRVSSNASLATLGARLLDYHVSAHLSAEWPRLPMAATRNAVDAYVGPKTLASIARGWGVNSQASPDQQSAAHLVHGRVPSRYLMTDESKGARYQEDAYADFVRALAAAIYVRGGTSSVRRFVADHVLSRQFEHASSFRVADPQRHLAHLCAREGLDVPTTRLVAETGRSSQMPFFSTALYVGSSRLSEGTGPSLRAAEHDAQSNALKAWYLLRNTSAGSSTAALDPSASLHRAALIDPGEVIV